MTVEAYPYLKLAKLHNVDYGLVLCFAAAYKKKFHELDCWEREATNALQHTVLADEIIAAYNTEITRRAVLVAGSKS